MPNPFAIDPEAFRRLVEEVIPLNAFLGLRLESFDKGAMRVVTRLPLKPEFVGNPVRKMPHGGIVAFLVDATAGAAAALAVDDLRHVDKLATVDMRVDYLEASKGQVLLASAQVARSGKRVVMVRSDVRDDLGQLVAAGSNVFHVARP